MLMMIDTFLHSLASLESFTISNLGFLDFFWYFFMIDGGVVKGGKLLGGALRCSSNRSTSNRILVLYLSHSSPLAFSFVEKGRWH